MKRFPPLFTNSLLLGCLVCVLSTLLSVANRLEAAESNSASAVTIEAGPEWVPLLPELDIVPGSALDFSKMGFTDAPAGKHGRVIAKETANLFSRSGRTACKGFMA